MKYSWQNPMTSTSEPRETYPHVLDFCKSLARDSLPAYLPIEASRQDAPVECMSNVQRRIEASGGTAVHGWAIWEWHGVMIEGEFHTVWRDTGETLHDVTPRSAPITRILFLASPTLSYKGQQVNNIRRPLIDNERVTEFIQLNNAEFEIMNRGERANQHGHIELLEDEAHELQRIQMRKAVIGRAILLSEPSRNDLCRCGSGRKWKKCHGR